MKDDIHKQVLSVSAMAVLGAMLVALVLLTVGSNEASGKTWYVNDDGGGDFEKIQDAIHNATESDIIRVYEGVYKENVGVNKTVSLIGNGSANTTIDGGGEGDVVNITANWCNLSGFRVTGSGDNGTDAGISVESHHNHIFENNCSQNYHGTFLNTSSSNNTLGKNIYYDNENSGVYLFESHHNTLSNNSCFGNDRGIFLDGSHNNSLINNTSSNNEYGVQIYCAISNNLHNNTFSDNGIGIYISGDNDECSKDNIAHNNYIFNNTNYGINVTDNKGNPINATHNWWGSNTGPYHPTENPSGSGDNVTLYVEFTPWIKKQNHRPSVIITSHLNNSEVHGTVTITGTSSDPDDGDTIQKVEISIDDGGWITVTGTATWSYEWDSTKMVNGDHIIKARAYDGKNFSDTVIWNLNVENQEGTEKPPGEDGSDEGSFKNLSNEDSMTLACGVLLVFNLIFAIWMYKDAESVGESGIKWFFVGLICSVIGCFFWILERPNY